MIKIRISYTEEIDLMKVIGVLKGFKVLNIIQDTSKKQMKRICLEFE